MDTEHRLSASDISILQSSPAAQLLLPDPKSMTVHLGKGGGELASIAYLAYRNDYLKHLDALIERFEIAIRGTTDFKKRLKEEWLNYDDVNRKRTGSNGVLAALCELVVADYLADRGHTIVDLSAWGSKQADVVYETDGCRTYCEVKMVSDSPEEFTHRVEAAKGDGVAGGWISGINERFNYFAFRLAEATSQLINAAIPKANRQVWFVIMPPATMDNLSLWFLQGLREGWGWQCSADNQYQGVLTKPEAEREAILRISPSDWLTEAYSFVVTTSDDFAIKSHQLVTRAR